MSNNNPKERITKNSKETLSRNFVQIRIAAPTPTGIRVQPKPSIGQNIQNTDRRDVYIEDPEIRRLQMIMLLRSPQNMRWCFNHDNSCKTSAFVLSQAIIGATGLTVKTEEDELKEILDDYHAAINHEWIIQKSLEDNHCFADSVWWLDYNDEKQLVIPKWVDYVTLKRITNPHTGGVKWIQVVWIDSKAPKTDGPKWKAYEPFMDYLNMAPRMQEPIADTVRKTDIMEDDVLNFQFFTSPPMVTIAEIVLWKKWMQFDSKLGGQKYATPIIDAALETPENYDVSTEESSRTMEKIADDLNRLMNFGVLAHSDKIKLQSINQQGQVFQFVQYLEYADKMIHKAILVPANLLEATGSELATSRTTKDMFMIIINAFRHRYIKKFHALDMKYLEFIGRKTKKKDFSLIFSEDDAQQAMTQNDEFINLTAMWDRGLLKDPNEFRHYIGRLGMQFPLLSDQELGEIEARELEKMIMEQIGNVPTSAENESSAKLEKKIKLAMKR